MGHDGAGAVDPYVVNADIVALSYMEWRDYHKKIGYSDGANTNFWLRTGPATNKAGNSYPVHKSALMVCATTGEVNYSLFESSLGVRPAFYLNNEFFKTTKIDINGMGANVKSILLNYSPAELAEAGYTSDELKALGFEEISIDYYEQDGKIGAQVYVLKCEDFTADVSSMKLIISAYSDNILHQIWVETPQQINNSRIYSAKIEIPVSQAKVEHPYFRAMFWESFNSTTPLAEVYDY